MNQSPVLVCIPTYNEKDNVLLLYEKIRKLPIELSILFIDDSSPDGTGIVIDRIASQDSLVHTIHRPGKLGLGTAHLRAFDYARIHNYKYLITMDADLTHDPKYIPLLLSKKNDADIVIASRYAKGAQMRGWSKIRLPLTYFWRRIIIYTTGLSYDATGAYKLYNVAILKPEVCQRVFSRGFSFGMESLFRFKEYGARIIEIPIQAYGRAHGRSKLSITVMTECVKTVWKLSREYSHKKNRKNHEPLQ